MIIFAAQKIHEAEVHIAAIDRELADIDAVLPHAGGPDRCQVWDVRSTVDAGPDTHLACPAAARAMASALAFSYQYARAREANQSRRGIACSRSPPRKPDARKRQELARVIERLRSPGLTSGLARELCKNVASLEREIAELEQVCASLKW